MKSTMKRTMKRIAVLLLFVMLFPLALVTFAQEGEQPAMVALPVKDVQILINELRRLQEVERQFKARPVCT